MSGPYPSDDEIRAELAQAHADIERTRADIERTRAELAETVEALSREKQVNRERGQDGAHRHPEQRVKQPTYAAAPRPLGRFAQVAKPLAVRATGDMRRATVSAAGLLWFLLVLRSRRRHRR